MDWELWLKLGHVAFAIALAAGLLGRWILLSRAASSDDVEESFTLAHAASPFERLVQSSGPFLLGFGLATAWAQGYPWLGLTTGWMLLSVILLLPLVVLVPAVFIPHGRIFEAEMNAARAAGTMTPGLRDAWNDRAVAMARRYELASIALIVALMVLKPF